MYDKKDMHIFLIKYLHKLPLETLDSSSEDLGRSPD